MIDLPLGLLLLKMALAAGIVVGCSLLAEKAGPLLAAMIATLPISIGPIYVFLALDHDAAFISQSALASMSGNLGNALLCLVYVLLAQRHGVVVSLLPALASWLATVSLLNRLHLPVAIVLGLTVLVFPLVHLALRRYGQVRPDHPPGRPWYAIPLRALGVALLAGSVTVLSETVGPVWSGAFAAAPIVLPSLIVMLQPRIGGRATAALIANCVLGLFGFGFVLSFVHLAAERLGSWLALLIALLLCMGWNLSLIGLGRARRPTP